MSRKLRIEYLEARDVPTTYDLGVAADFNAFIFDDLTVANSDIRGRVAVGRDATISSYGIGDGLPNSFGTRDDLIVGNDLTFTNGQVFFGNIVYGGTGTLQSVGIPNGTARQEAGVVDFDAARTSLTAMSAALGAEAPNGRTSLRRGNITLRGTHPELNFFTLVPEKLTGARSISVIVPTGSTVIINVPGAEADIHNLGLSLRGADCSTVLWNFFEAEAVNASGVGLYGSILAPSAAFNFNNGQMDGTVIAASMTGTGELHICRSEVRVVIPEPATLQGVVFIDGNADNEFSDPELDEGFPGALVFLTGRDSLGRRVSWEALTENQGVFQFGPLWPGTYNLTLEPPQRYEQSNLFGIPGTVAGTTVGAPAVNQVQMITLDPGDEGIDYLLPLSPNAR